MGVVYRAEDRIARREVALKRVLTGTTSSARAPSRGTKAADGGSTVAVGDSTDETDPQALALAREFRFLASLRHPNIISVLDFGFDTERRPFFTMEWIRGARTILDASRQGSTEDRIELVAQLLRALVYLHRRGIVHRDLKPSNVLVTEDDTVKVLDFGISMMSGGSGDEGSGLSGTVAYMAPEMLGDGEPGEAADLYAVGTISYELLAGRHPFDTGNRDRLVAQLLVDTPDMDALRRVGVDDGLCEVVRRLMAKDPEDRHATAAVVLRHIAEVVRRPDLAETSDTRESLLQSARFVGREAEMEQLIGAWRDTRRNERPRFWLVGGESGVGKSRVMDELRVHALVDGATVIRGRAVRDGGTSYQVWREVSRYLALREDLTPLDLSVLKSLVPDIATVVGHPVGPPPDLEAQSAQERLQRLMVRLLKRHASPTLLILEDLQWADHVSLTLLRRMTEELVDQPLMLVGNYRSDEAPELRDMFLEASYLTLPRLPRARIADLTRSMLGKMGEDQSENVVELIHATTAGNAFFVVEALRTLARHAGGLERVGTLNVTRDMLEGSLGGIIDDRLEGLPGPLNRLLEFAAVLGRDVDVDVLDALAESPDDVPELTARATEIGVLTVEEDTYRFAHDKIRDGILETISDARLPGLHERVATTIEGVHADVLDEYAITLAYHWGEAGTDDAKEAKYAALAGRQLVERGSYRDGIPYLTRALSLYRTVTADELDTGQLERILGEAYFSDGQMERARIHLKNSTRLLGAAFPVTDRGVLLGLVAEALKQAAHRVLPGALFERSGADARRALEASLAYERLSHIIFFDNRTVPLLYASMRALNLAENAPPSAELSRAYGTICYSLGLVPLYPPARFYERKALEVGRLLEAEGRPIDPWVWEITAFFHSSKGDLETGIERYRRGAATALEIGYVSRWLECTTLLEMNYYQLGRFEESAELREVVREHAVKTNNEQAMGWAWLGMVEYALRCGDLAEAAEFLDRSGRVTERIGFTERAWMHGLRARMQSMRGDLPAVKAAVDDALALLKDVPLPNAYYTQEGYTALAEACLEMAEHPESEGIDRAWLATSTKLAMKRLRGFARSFPASRSHVQRIEGWHAWQRGKEAKARRHWQRAIQEADRLGKRFEKGLVHYDMGRFLRGGSGHLQEALAIFEDLGFEYHLRRVGALLSGGEPGRPG